MSQLDREPLEGVPLLHVGPDSLLELLRSLAASSSSSSPTPLLLVAGQSWGQQVAESVIPHCAQTKVLRERESKFSGHQFSDVKML